MATDLQSGGTGYPASIDINPTEEAADEVTDRVKVNGNSAAIIAIETELGVEPAGGTLATVKDFLQVHHTAADGTHNAAAVAAMLASLTFKNPLVFTLGNVVASLSAVALGVAGAPRELDGSATWDPGNLADGAGETKSITVTGAALGDYVLVAAPYDLQDMVATAYVQAADTVEIRLQNESGGAIDLASGTWKVKVMSDNPVNAALVDEVCMPWAGSVVGISVFSNAARTAGTLTVDATINGAVTGLQAELDGTNTVYHSAAQAIGVDAVAANDRVGVKITTTAGWLPITADITVVVFVSFN